MYLPERRVLVESLFGSQPTCITFKPVRAKAALIFEVVVDFPMPPLPYIATCLIFLSAT
jgi:hypothetical protein